MTPEEFLDKLAVINDDEKAISAHRHWEEVDEEWKQLIKNDAPRYDILVAANKVRNAKAYKDLLFDEAARKAESLAEESGFLNDYHGDVLGHATQIGEVQELSKEWHDLRRKGVGGSSLSEAIGFHWKSFPGSPIWMSNTELDEHWSAMAIEKSTPAREPKPIESGVLFRGHKWEPALLCYYSAVTGTPISISKATWRGHRDIQVINVDGIITDESGKPVGIAECKTSSREWTWDRGVPVHYRAQTLWYLDATGLEYADLIVRFDSGKIDIHRINAGETIDGSTASEPVTGYTRKIMNRWKTLNKMIANPLTIWDHNEDLMKEIDQLEQEGIYSLEEGFLMDIQELYEDSIVVKIDVVAPYERMDKSFNRSLMIHTNTGIDDYIQNVSPAYYPTPIEYDPREGIHMDEVDAMLGEHNFIIAIDNETYNHLTLLYGHDGIINLAALRRVVEELPALPGFETITDAVQWIEHIEDEK